MENGNLSETRVLSAIMVESYNLRGRKTDFSE